MFTSQGMVPPLVTFRLSSGFSSGPYAGLSVDADTVTRFWLQPGVGVGVGVGAALGTADGESLGAGADPAASAVALSVEDACSVPLKTPATAKPPNARPTTISRAIPTNSRRRR